MTECSVFSRKQFFRYHSFTNSNHTEYIQCLLFFFSQLFNLLFTAYKSMLMVRGEEYDASVEICRIKDNLARHRNDLHAMLLESVDYMANNTNSDIGNNSVNLEAGMETKSLASGSRKSSSVIGSAR